MRYILNFIFNFQTLTDEEKMIMKECERDSFYKRGNCQKKKFRPIV